MGFIPTSEAVGFLPLMIIKMKFTDYFDKIFLINLIDREDKKSFMIEQFKRLGIYDDMINDNKLEIYEAVKMPFFKKEVVDTINTNLGGNSGLLQCAMSHYAIISKCLQRGYDRVLILEDDACFLKNIDTICTALENAPEDFNLLHLEGYYFPAEVGASWDDWANILSDTPESGKWESSDFYQLWATAAIVWSQKGMEIYKQRQNEQFHAPDVHTLLMENSYFYTYPLIRQEDKNIVVSDSFNYSGNVESTNAYLLKSDNNLYYHIYNIKKEA